MSVGRSGAFYARRRRGAIPFNQQVTLTQFPANVVSQSVVLDAVLKPFGPPKTGPFNATATIRLFIY